MFRILFFFVLLLYNSEGRPKEIKCPEYCVCDIFERLRRATCQNKKLYSIELDVPRQVQILDLSYNQISELGMNVFLELNLSKLKLLNISHNKVSQIHLYGFEGLDNLKTLDLSYNMIQYFHQQWFVSLASLQELYLRGNNLRSINNEPKLTLKNLRVLDISSSKIENLYPDIFENLPNLEVLDVSGNNLVHLKVDTIRSLPKLNKLVVKSNTFRCKEPAMKQLRNYTINKGITYQDPCEEPEKPNRNEKFQRMMISASSLPEKNVWIYEDDEEISDIKVVEVCTAKKMNETRNIVDKMLMQVIDLSPSIVLLVTLIFGISVGILLGCSCQFRPALNEIREEEFDFESAPVLRRANSFGSRSFRRQNSTGSTFRPRTRSTGSRKMLRDDRNFLLMHETKLSDSTPVLTRKVAS